MARVVVGFAVALSAIAECVYISEIAPAATRGALVSLNELGITIGIFLSYLVNYLLITQEGGWRAMFGISTVPAVVQGVGVFNVLYIFLAADIVNFFDLFTFFSIHTPCFL